MNEPNPLLIVPLATATMAAAMIATIFALRMLRARRNARRRVVELPNSHYTSPLVLNTEKKHRWQNIALADIHEVNRGEVERLLAKLEALGVDALRETERVFLDNFADLTAPPPPAEPRGQPRAVTPDLREHPV
jgi:hypothetical protein